MAFQMAFEQQLRSIKINREQTNNGLPNKGARQQFMR